LALIGVPSGKKTPFSVFFLWDRREQYKQINEVEVNVQRNERNVVNELMSLDSEPTPQAESFVDVKRSFG